MDMLDTRLKETLGAPALRRLMSGLRRRYEAGAGTAAGTISLRNVTAAERSAIDSLLGRHPSDGEPLVVRLDRLNDMIKHAGLADNLRMAIELLSGPIKDRREAKLQELAAWNSVFSGAESYLKGRSELAPWLDKLKKTGLLKRLTCNDPKQASALLECAIQIAIQLPHRGTTLTEFAVHVLRDAHALDRNKKLASVLTGALSILAGMECVSSRAQYRRAWDRLGVAWNELSSSALILNLPADTDTLTGELLRVCAVAGEPCRLTTRQLLRYPPSWRTIVPPKKVYVCENPTVMSAAAKRFGSSSLPLVCIEGQPSTAIRVLLQRLVEHGTELLYHGDFDWPGILIANFIVSNLGASLWRMKTIDYRKSSLHAKLSLKGKPVDALWDAGLRSEMEGTDRAIHEEQVLQELILDLAT
jgi:uncharacterized protein (TIGR02679 family)